MNKVENVLVVAAGKAINELTCGAAQIGSRVTLVYAGARDSAMNSDKAYYLGDRPFFSCGPAAAKLALAEKPQLVLLDSSKDSLLVASHIAAAFGTSVQTNTASILVGDGIITDKLVYGGAAVKTEKSSGAAVVCVSPGVFSQGAANAVADISDVLCEGDERIKVLETRAKAASSVNLSLAKKIVGVGRGLADEEALKTCRSFAESIGAELGCTRPICEERSWMEKERYIGVSGAVVQPECYIAVGISGQVQHIVGINKSGTIIAIDKNEAAPIFKSCDYGIVGDLHKIVPQLQQLIEE